MDAGPILALAPCNDVFGYDNQSTRRDRLYHINIRRRLMINIIHNKLLVFWLGIFLQLITGLFTGCIGNDGTDANEVSSLSLKLTGPSGAACIEEIVQNVVSGRETMRVFELTPGVSQVLNVVGVPAGDIEITAIVTDTFSDDSCTGNVMYEAVSQRIRVNPGGSASVDQRFLTRADLEIDGTFEDEIYEVAECADPVNIALGTDASLSDDGWGGGTQKADITDGQTEYCDQWSHGLAFTGGASQWGGASCGWRQMTLDLGGVRSFTSARIYHHGAEHIPATYSLEVSLDGNEWLPIDDTSSVRSDLTTGEDGCWGATPTEHLFDEVSARYFRFNLNNCEMMFPTTDSHGWIYDVQLFACENE